VADVELELVAQAFVEFADAPLNPALFTDDFTFRPSLTGGDMVTGGVYVGQAGWERYWRDALDVWSSIRAELRSARSCGGGVVLAEGMLRAVGRASRVEVAMPTFLVFEIRAGRIARIIVHNSPEEAQATLRALGR
jgi:hypothetical protein